MAFYKLYRIVHRRTDWQDLLDWERRIMMPEWYEETERRARAAVSRLMLPFAACNVALNGRTDYI